MTGRYPRIRLPDKYGHGATREAVAVSFYLEQPWREVAPLIADAIERYLRVSGPLVASHAMESGQHFMLDSTGWAHLRGALMAGALWAGTERTLASVARGYGFFYTSKEPPPGGPSSHPATILFWFPSEYLEEHGPRHMRSIVLDLLGTLPICSGTAGLALEVAPELYGRTLRWIGDLCLDCPGLDCFEFTNILAPGTRIRAPAWMTFVGQPVLGRVGGVAALRARIHSPGTTVEGAGEDRALVTLDEWPQLGDIRRGETLPAYRALAKAVEPWLCTDGLEPFPDDYFESIADYERWLRRFLD